MTAVLQKPICSRSQSENVHVSTQQEGNTLLESAFYFVNMSLYRDSVSVQTGSLLKH